MFAISATVFGLGNLFYIIFGSMELQPWDDEKFLLKNDVQFVDHVKTEDANKF